MAGTTWRWPAERRPELVAALSSSLTRKEAAAKIGETDNSLDYGCKVLGVDAGALLDAARRDARRAAAPAAVPVSAPAIHPGNLSITAPEPDVESVDWRGSRPAAAATGVERRLNIGDLHIPAHSTAALSCVYALIRALQPHKVFQLGDLLNAQAFTRHAPSSPRAERIDLATMAARGFVRAVKRASPGSELVIVVGNHDNWAARWEAENPAFEGSFDFETMLGIKNLPDDDRPPMFEGVRVVRHPEESGYVDGPIAYCHGTGGGMYAARRYAENVGPRAHVRHVRFAHHHTNQVFCHKNGIQARCVGWLGNEHDESNAFSYASPPRGWWLGVTLDDVAGDHVTTTDIEIRNGVAFFGGRLVAA